MIDGGLLLPGISSQTGNKDGAMSGMVVLVVTAAAAAFSLLFLHQTASTAAFLVSSNTASVVRGDKKDGCCSLASPYCHKSCGMGLEGNGANKPFCLERGVLGELGRGNDGMLDRPRSGMVSNLAEDQSGQEELRKPPLLL